MVGAVMVESSRCMMSAIRTMPRTICHLQCRPVQSGRGGFFVLPRYFRKRTVRNQRYRAVHDSGQIRPTRLSPGASTRRGDGSCHPRF